MTTLARTLAEWCGNYKLVFPPTASNRAETAILDTVGCMIAGAGDASVAGAATLAPDEPSGKAASLGHSARIPAAWAALVNACAAHALDYDDNFFPAVTHASAVQVPALLALAEECGAAPSEVVYAYIVGLEVQAQLGKILNPSHYESGWHATSTIGTVGAAAACARLLRLDADAILHAISIATSLAGGSKKQFGTMVKPLHAGFAAMHGVMAAKLAAAEIQGNPDVLQGRWSFEELFGGNADAGTLEPALFPDSMLAIEEFGLIGKLYPSCMSSHLAIDAILALREDATFNAENIAAVDVYLPAFMVENLRYHEPKDEMEARFSMHYCAAVAAVYGPPRLWHFKKNALSLNSLSGLMQRVRMHIREPSRDSTRLPWGGDGMARIRMNSGQVHEHIAVHPKGCMQNPLSPIEQRAKFFDCVEHSFDGAAAAALFHSLQRFSRLENVAGVTRHFPRGQ